MHNPHLNISVNVHGHGPFTVWPKFVKIAFRKKQILDQSEAQYTPQKKAIAVYTRLQITQTKNSKTHPNYSMVGKTGNIGSQN